MIIHRDNTRKNETQKNVPTHVLRALASVDEGARRWDHRALLVNLFKCRLITCVPQRQIRATQRRLNYNAVIYNDDRSAMYNVNMLVDLLCAFPSSTTRKRREK